MQGTMFVNRKRAAAFLTVFLLACALGVSAQVATGTLKGAIVGPEGGAIGSAHVTVVGKENAENTQTATSSSAGEYSIVNLTPGLYNVKVAAAGFKTVIAEDIDVLAGDAQELRFTLEPGDPQETIVISPETPPPAEVPAL